MYTIECVQFPECFVRDSDISNAQNCCEKLKKNDNYRDAILVALVNLLRMYVDTSKHLLDVVNPPKIVFLLRTNGCHLVKGNKNLK